MDRPRDISAPGVGSRVRLRHDVDRFPHFLAPAGLVGTVVDVGDRTIYAVRFDREIEGAEEWQNEIHWFIDQGDDPTEDLEQVMAGDFVNHDALQALTSAELRQVIEDGGPAA